MLVPFDSLPEDARIWIYPSNRKFADQEIDQIHNELTAFISNWSAHSNPLTASYTIMHDRFIILAVNQENQAVTGCSIDASVACIQQLEQRFQIDLLDKMNVTFRQGEYITHKSLLEFKKMVKEKSVSANTIVFNNLVNTIEEWKACWEVPASESWHSRFF